MELQRNWPEQWSHVNEIRRCGTHYMALRMFWCLLTCSNYAVCVATCFWVVPVRHASNYSCSLSCVLTCNNLTDKMCLWQHDHVTSYSWVTCEQYPRIALFCVTSASVFHCFSSLSWLTMSSATGKSRGDESTYRYILTSATFHWQ